MYMNKRKTFFVFVLVMVFILGTAINVSATSAGKNITVFFNNIKLMVDGEVVTPKDANGNVVEPFIYNGTTYLPVRALAEALGQDVNWDAETSTVVVGEYDAGESLYPDVKLEEMEDLYTSGGVHRKTEGIKDNFGNEYNGYTSIFKASELGKVGYALNGQYSKLTGTIILKHKERSRDDINGEIVFTVDDKVVKTISLLSVGDSPVDFQIDLKNANLLEIGCASNGGFANAIVNAGFYK